jgi:hypothetical protein
MQAFAGGTNCINSLRLLSNEYLKNKKPEPKVEKELEVEQLKYFCLFSKN